MNDLYNNGFHKTDQDLHTYSFRLSAKWELFILEIYKLKIFFVNIKFALTTNLAFPLFLWSLIVSWSACCQPEDNLLLENTVVRPFTSSSRVAVTSVQLLRLWKYVIVIDCNVSLDDPIFNLKVTTSSVQPDLSFVYDKLVYPKIPNHYRKYVWRIHKCMPQVSI